MFTIVKNTLFRASSTYLIRTSCAVYRSNPLFLNPRMSQKSITSFFSKAPQKSLAPKTSEPDKTPEKQVKCENEDSCSPIKIGTRGSKRLRIDSSDSDSNSPPEKRTSVDILEAKPNGNVIKIEPEETAKDVDKIESDITVETLKKSPDEKIKSNKKPAEKKAAKNPKKEQKNKSIDKSAKTNSKSKKSSVKEEKVSSSEESDDEKIKINKKGTKKKAVSSSEESGDEKMDISNENGVKIESETKEKSTPKSQKKMFNSFFTSVKKADSGNSENSGNQDKKDGKSGADYDPSKAKYHPIDDAFWSRNEKVPYLALAKTLEEIEKISARLKIVELLSNFFRSVIILTPCDLLPSVYLCLNRLAPAYESVELGIAETTLMKAIAQSCGRTVAQVRADCNSMGDLGLVAEQSKSNQRVMFQPAPLTVRGVFGKLKDIAQMTGHSSMSKKVDKIQSMFVACKHSESRFLIRSLAGKLRVGLAEQSVLQALAQACTCTPPLGVQGDSWPPEIINSARGLTAEQAKAQVDAQALVLKTTYCSCPNYDMIIPIILEHGIPALPDHCRLTPGIPLKPMLAHPTKGVHEVLHRFENVEFTCEWKYDGERAQIHVPSAESEGVEKANITRASIYSRNQENNTSKYPDVLARLDKTMKDSVKSCVLDCEAVAWDKDKKQILPFQVLSTRKKKDASESDIKVNVCLFMFDLLYFNGESLVKRPFEERRKLLRDNFTEVEGEWHMASSLDCSTTESIQEFLEESVKGNCEGLMVKTLNGKDATYEIAKRSRNWLKLKKDYLDGVGDTIDAVVLGGYRGRGKRAGVYGGFLLACHDRSGDEYQTLCKIGTGFSDQDLVDRSKSLAEHVIPAPKGYYRYDPSLEPDDWFAAVEVWEVKCADLSLSPIHRAGVGIVDSEKGISLRFPRFIRVRDDKTAEEATSSQQIAEMYCGQDQVKNQAHNANKNFEDDFY